jgi:hypothetical protein
MDPHTLGAQGTRPSRPYVVALTASLQPRARRRRGARVRAAARRGAPRAATARRDDGQGAWRPATLTATLTAQSQQAYRAGHGGDAHELSCAGKAHGARADALNAQASALIFAANNGGRDADTIDLHGQYVAEAAALVEARLRAARAAGRPWLHVVVGRGTHSREHVQRVRPCVERVCAELGMQCAVEANEGRMLVSLQSPPPQQQQPDDIEVVKLPRIVRKLGCCVVM